MHLLAGIAVAVTLTGALAGCAVDDLSADDGRLRVITTTGILADLARNVGGGRVDVSSLVPDGADPQSYEPSLRDIRNVVYADVGFSNYQLFEPQSVIKALDANLGDDVPNVALAEGAVKYAAEIIPLVENAALDTIWLGMRVQGTGDAYGASRASDVYLSGTRLDGPGNLVSYLTEAFGNPSFYVNSTDGFDPSTGYRDDTAVLPPDAHTHMSWAFTQPGVYRLTMRASLAVTPGTRPVQLGEEVFTFAVGVDPHSVPATAGGSVVDAGHADITVDLDDGGLFLLGDSQGGGHAHDHVYDPAATVIAVPNKALHDVPEAAAYRFLGDPDEQIFQLPQAVLGRHIHGEIDPHLWQDVRNAMSYVELIRDTLIDADPDGASMYRDNANAYIAELVALDGYVRDTIDEIPESRRYLVTTHNSFGYLGAAYDVEIAGFVTPNPATEPSLSDRRRLAETIRNLDIPAVFREPNLVARASTLTEVAGDEGAAVCPVYGDTFDDEVTTYVDMMRFNAESLRSCLAEPAERNP